MECVSNRGLYRIAQTTLSKVMSNVYSGTDDAVILSTGDIPYCYIMLSPIGTAAAAVSIHILSKSYNCVRGSDSVPVAKVNRGSSCYLAMQVDETAD